MISTISIICFDVVVFFLVVKFLDAVRNHMLSTSIKKNIYLPILRCFQYCGTIYELLEAWAIKASDSKITYNPSDLIVINKVLEELEEALEEIGDSISFREFFENFDYYYAFFKDKLFNSLKDIMNLSANLLIESPEIFLCFKALSKTLAGVKVFNNNLMRYGDYLDKSYAPIDDTAFYK